MIHNKTVCDVLQKCLMVKYEEKGFITYIATTDELFQRFPTSVVQLIRAFRNVAGLLALALQ